MQDTMDEAIWPDWEMPDLQSASADFQNQPNSITDVIATAEEGDHIAIKAEAGYWHHGIFLGRSCMSPAGEK